MSDFIVKVEYKNKNLETVVEKEYDFISYTEMLNLELMRLIMEIEDAFYIFSGNKQKEEWPPELAERFKKIRHKMLDQANAIKRLPQNLSYKGVTANQVSISDFVDHHQNKKMTISKCNWQSVDDDMVVKCTACGQEFRLADLQNVSTDEIEDVPNYCPNCGAKTVL